MINLDDFKKLDLRVAKIISAEKVEGTNKLLKLDIDLGDERRQIISGIAEMYKPEELVGKEIVVIANLEARTLKGIESQGMLLAASGENGPVLLMPERAVPSGSKIS